MKSLYPLLLLGLILGGCAHEGLSREAVNLADRTLSYPVLRENPDRYVGKFIEVGGVIAGVRNTGSGGELEVVELPLDSSGRPKGTANSEGRFLARADRFIDPLIFKPGLPVSLVGEVRGHRVATLDKLEYHYPVIRIQEIHLWTPEEAPSTPSFHLGVGVFKGF